MDLAALLSRPPSFSARKCDAASALSRPADSQGDSSVAPDSSRSAPYTVHDDLSILKVIALYYGVTFHGKIPWSFWQTYKRVTHSTRSNSSLYHHWNGAMRKRYEPFLASGRMSECIAWLETAATAERLPAPAVPMPTGLPLCHVRSTPPVPLRQPPPAGRPLVRTASHRPEACCPFVRMQEIMNRQ
jgi:hypothetical protein